MNSVHHHSKHDYPRSAYDLLFAVEDKHFWFRARNSIIKRAVRRTVARVSGMKFLEVGCGTGYVLSMLEHMGCTVTGLDFHARALEFARKRTHATLVKHRLESFHSKEKFDAIGAFDVLEHVVDDISFIKRCSTLLKKGGHLYLTVPAGKELWTDIDTWSGHKRRYSKNGLTEVLNQNGYTIEYIRYFGFFLYVPYRLVKSVVHIIHRTQGRRTLSALQHVMTVPPGIVNTILEWCYTAEDVLAQYMPIPFGTSLIVSAKLSG